MQALPVAFGAVLLQVHHAVCKLLQDSGVPLGGVPLRRILADGLLQSCMAVGMRCYCCPGIAEASQLVPENLLHVPFASSTGSSCAGESAGLWQVLGYGQPGIVEAVLETGWSAMLKLLLTLFSSPEGGSVWGPSLLSATAFFCLHRCHVHSATRAQALCISPLAEGGLGQTRGPGAEWLCREDHPWAGAAGRAVGSSSRCPVPHLPGQSAFPPASTTSALVAVHWGVDQEKCRMPPLQAADWHIVRVHDDYWENVVGLPARLQRNVAKNGVESRSLQWHYHVFRGPTVPQGENGAWGEGLNNKGGCSSRAWHQDRLFQAPWPAAGLQVLKILSFKGHVSCLPAGFFCWCFHMPAESLPSSVV